MRKLLLSLFFFCVVSTGKSIANESWGAALFKTRHHDFGYVVLGADAEFPFELTNLYDREVKLTSVRSSCGCAVAKFSTSLLKPGETGAVIVRFNTSGQHLRDTSAVLTVQLETVINGSRKIDTVQLFVTGYIRPDVLLTPGIVEFGAVVEGMAAVRTLQLEYTGRPGWALTKVERSQSFFHAKAEEVRRIHGNVTYKITVTLKNDAPVGYVKDILRFTTNELQPGKTEPMEILLPIQGVVTAAIYAKPSPMLVGILMPGETVVKNIVVRSETPFRITNVTTSDRRFRFAFSDQESAMHMVSVSFSANHTWSNQPQDIAEEIRIFTNDARQKSMIIRAFAQVIPSW